MNEKIIRRLYRANFFGRWRMNELYIDIDDNLYLNNYFGNRLRVSECIDYYKEIKSRINETI